jgi:uncharacterized protein with FMN-binding domain
MTSPRQRTHRPGIHGSSAIPSRAILAILGTIIGLVLLVSFKTPDALPLAEARFSAPPVAASSPAAPGAVAGGGVSPVPSRGLIAAGSGAPTATAAPTGAPGTGDGRGASGGRSTSPPATTRPAPTPAPTSAPAAASGDAVGPVEQTPYGNVQVEVKVSGGQIVEVVALQLPNDRRRSAQISQYVAPILHDEALQAQSAQIDGISGATWTSGGYQASLQGALDKLANG